MNSNGDATGLESMIQAFLRSVAEKNQSDPENPGSLRSWMDLAETWRILTALRDCRGNRSAAARELGIGRRTLYAKMERLGIGRVEDGPAPPVQATPSAGFEVHRAS